MIKKLDLYIIRKFLGTFFFIILLFIAIVIVFDYTEKIDNFTEYNAPMDKVWLIYYLNLVPYFVSMFIPMFIFIAVIYFTSRLAYRSEIIAILSSGISFNRLLRPYFMVALFLALLSFLLQAYVIPPATKKRIEFETQYVSRKKYRLANREHIHRQISSDTFIYLRYYYSKNKYGRVFFLENYKNNKLIKQIRASKITWLSETKQWKLTNCKIRIIDENKETLLVIPRLDTTLNLVPGELAEKKDEMQTMNLTALNKYIKDQTKKGNSSITAYRLEKYSRLFNPFSAFILTLIGASLASRKIRGGIGLHLGLGLLISFSYILFLKLSGIFAISGNISTILSVVTPSILFGTIAFILYRFSPK